MVYESVVDKASGSIDLFLVPFSCFIESHDGCYPSAFGKAKKGRVSEAYGYLGRLKLPVSTESEFC